MLYYYYYCYRYRYRYRYHYHYYYYTTMTIVYFKKVLPGSGCFAPNPPPWLCHWTPLEAQPKPSWHAPEPPFLPSHLKWSSDAFSYIRLWWMLTYDERRLRYAEVEQPVGAFKLHDEIPASRHGRVARQVHSDWLVDNTWILSADVVVPHGRRCNLKWHVRQSNDEVIHCVIIWRETDQQTRIHIIPVDCRKCQRTVS